MSIENIERPHGQSNYGLARTLNVFIDLFFLYFFTRYADRPIRIFGKVSLGSLGIGILIAFGLLVEYAATGRPVVRERSGWFMLSSFLMLTAVQVLLTGILAELLARVYFARDDRTSYQDSRRVVPTPGA